MTPQTKLKELIASGLTMTEIAKRVGCSVAAISRYVDGSRENPSYATYRKIMALKGRKK